MTASTLAPGGPRPAELPPTLQPHAIASMAPPARRGAALAFSFLSYGLLASAMVAAASLPPSVVGTFYTTVPVPLNPDRPAKAILARVQPAPASKGGGAPARGEAAAEPARPSANDIPDTPSNLSTVDHSNEIAGTGPGTGKPGTGGEGGEIGTDPNGGGGGAAPSTGPVEIAAAQVQVLSSVQPVYPAMAKLARVQGSVVLLMTIDARGVPTAVEVVSGPPQLQAEALRAARLWRFSPALVGGQAVPAQFRLTIDFKLR